MQKINFQNLPSTSTPINATNLNAIQTNVENVFNGSVTAGNMVVDSIRTKNVLNKDLIIQNYGLNTETGEPYSASNRNYVDYIIVKPSTTYTLSGCTPVATFFYSSNRTYISYATGFTFTTPSNCQYLRIAINNTYSYSNIQLEEGSTATSYSPYQDLNNDVLTGQVNLDISTTAVEINSYARSGKVASLKLTITIQNQVSANATTQIAHDLPKPNSIFGNNGWEFFGVSKSDKSNIRCRIDVGGTLTFWYLNNQIPAGTQLYFFTTYITN